MASRYHPFYDGLWHSPHLEGLPFEGKAFFGYLCSNERLRPSGIYRVTDAQLAVDTELPMKRVRRYIVELVNRHRIVRDGAWIFVRGYLGRQPKGGRLMQGVETDVAECTSAAVLRAFGEKYPYLDKWSTDRLATIGNPCTKNVVSEQLQSSKAYRTVNLQNNEPTEQVNLQSNKTTTRQLKPSAGAALRTAVGTPGRTSPVWDSYRAAYERRYGTTPVRNRTVNGQLAQLVERLGQDAAAVAGFYVNSNAAWYVGKGHAVGILLQDAEKLHTEWVTGRRVMARDAREMDDTQGRFTMYQKFIERASDGEQATD